MHRPVDSDTVRKWVLKNGGNAEPENWKIVNTKPCPKCGRAIEKNQSRMHMTCVAPCCFEFCWLCLGDWNAHSYNSTCNRFQVDDQGTETIVECRRVLKWTYAYGYYLSQDETALKNMFEHSQAYVESSLERLHRCVEEEVQVFIASQKPPEEFNEFRVRLLTLTTITAQYIQNLVKFLEKSQMKEY
ncbi:hypothetical protein SUGI_0558140 [Cryptomeria japonica]|nr:hypothetical protein SUGI_0558140 [Cryptomeria japonica]